MSDNKKLPNDKNVKKDIDQMFNQVPFWDRVKLQIVTYQYKKESPMFKMMFDRKYRNGRYQLITSNEKTFKNKSQFRSHVYTNHNDFPLTCTEYMNLNILKKLRAQNRKTEDEQVEEEHPEDTTQNVLLQNKILKHHTEVLQVEMMSYTWVLTLIGYVFLSIPFKIMNKRVWLSIAVPGMFWSMLALIHRSIKFKEYEMQVAQLYKKERTKYEEFFMEERYD